MNDWQVAIPSHNRVDQLNTKTLRTLAEGGVPRDRVKVFVAPDQYVHYQNNIDWALVGGLHTGGVGLAANRNAINAYYLEHSDVVQMDDDVQQLSVKLDDKATGKVEDLSSFFDFAFDRMKADGHNLRGVYPSHNPMFMKFLVRAGLWFCIGQMFGYVNTHDPKMQTTIANKDDYERTLLHYERDGGVTRFDAYACKSPMFGAGGLQSDEFDRHTMNRQEVRYLLKRWPANVKLAKRRSKVGLEIRLVE